MRRIILCSTAATAALFIVVSAWKGLLSILIALIWDLVSDSQRLVLELSGVALVPPVKDVTRTGLLSWLGTAAGGSLRRRCLALAICVSALEWGRMLALQHQLLADVFAWSSAPHQAIIVTLLIANLPLRVLVHFTLGYVQALIWPVSVLAFLAVSSCHAGLNVALALQQDLDLVRALLVADLGGLVVSALATLILFAMRLWNKTKALG